MIDNVDFHNLPVQKYWSAPSSWTPERRKQEVQNAIFSGDYIGSRKMDGAFYQFIKDNEGHMELIGRSKSVSGDYLDKIEWGKYKNILLFKTLILTQEDMKVPEIILEKNKKCSVVVCSIFLAPKFADILMNSQLDTLLLNTLYFSDFFIKFEHLIRKDQTAFNAKELSNLFKQEIPKVFMDQQ